MPSQQKTCFRLYFGLFSKKIGIISKDDFIDFCEKHITPCFKSFTIIYALGFWENTQENTAIVELILNDTFHIQSQIGTICNAYKTQFYQDCILVSKNAVDIKFI